MDDYHRPAAIETFTASNGDRHPTDLAGLRGARLVTSTETEEGRRWAESRIKQLTGGDIVSARFMRQDFFDYLPQFKLFITGNHKPSLRSVDEAIRRRFHLIPFAVTIPAEERDAELGGKAQDRMARHPAWLVNGCLEWQKRGLAAPEIVSKATADYLMTQDSFSFWLEECCERDPNAETSSTALFSSWKGMGRQGGRPPWRHQDVQRGDGRERLRRKHTKKGNGCAWRPRAPTPPLARSVKRGEGSARISTLRAHARVTAYNRIWLHLRSPAAIGLIERECASPT